MSSGDSQLIVDKTDKSSTSSHEAVIILAVVLGVFLVILIGLCVLRYRVNEKIGVVVAKSLDSDSKYREQTSNSSWQARLNKMTSVAGESITQDELTMYRRAQSVGNNLVHNSYRNDELPNVHSYPKVRKRAGRVAHPAASPEKRRRRQLLDYSGHHQTNEIIPETTSVFIREEALYDHYEQYDKSTRCASEATDDYTSVEKMEESDVTHEYDQGGFGVPIAQLSGRPNDLGHYRYKSNPSIMTSPSIRRLSLSAVPLHDSDDNAPPRTWNLGNDFDKNSTRSTLYRNPNEKPHRTVQMLRVIEGKSPTAGISIATSYSTSELGAVQRNSRRVIDQRYSTVESGYVDSQTEQKRKHPGDIIIPNPSTKNQGIVEVAVDTPFFESERSITENDRANNRFERFAVAGRSGVSRFDSVALAGNTDFPEVHPHNRPYLQNIESKGRTPDGGDITRGYITTPPEYERTHENKHGGLRRGEASPMMMPELNDNIPSSSWMPTEELESTPTYQQYNRDSFEIHQAVAQ